LKTCFNINADGSTKISSAAGAMAAEAINAAQSNTIQNLPGNKVVILLFWATGLLVKGT
jgi:hypothetical protein